VVHAGEGVGPREVIPKNCTRREPRGISGYITRVPTDAELLAAWRGGDRTAGDELIRRHFDPICRFFRAKLGDDVEDLIQKTFLDCVSSKERVADDGFRAYLFAVAKNRLYDHLRARYRAPEAVDVSEQSLADLGTTPSQALARDREEQLLLAAMRRIPLEYQIALELAYWEGLSGPEIATVLSIPANTVRSRLARARAAIKDQLERLADAPETTNSTLARLDTAIAALR
jgi:RNA polymerase sigma-70 factor (ECF subfamily)